MVGRSGTPLVRLPQARGSSRHVRLADMYDISSTWNAERRAHSAEAGPATASPVRAVPSPERRGTLAEIPGAGDENRTRTVSLGS
jgi:hypothetical protein